MLGISLKITYTDGYYCGQMNSRGQMHGVGVYRWQNGDSYQGDWFNDRFQGFGVYHWAVSNETYGGELVNDKAEGYGIRLCGDGRIEDGQWNNGQYVGI